MAAIEEAELSVLCQVRVYRQGKPGGDVTILFVSARVTRANRE